MTASITGQPMPADEMEPCICSRPMTAIEQQQHDDRSELAADQGDVLEAGIEAAMSGIRDLAEIGGAGAVFAAEAQAFDNARQRENGRRGEADRGIGRRDRDDQ